MLLIGKAPTLDEQEVESDSDDGAHNAGDYGSHDQVEVDEDDDPDPDPVPDPRPGPSGLQAPVFDDPVPGPSGLQAPVPPSLPSLPSSRLLPQTVTIAPNPNPPPRPIVQILRCPPKFSVSRSSSQAPVHIPPIFPTKEVPQVLTDSMLNVNSVQDFDAEVVLDATNVALIKGYPKGSAATKFKILYSSPDPVMQAELNLLYETMKAFRAGINPPNNITQHLVKMEMDQARRYRVAAQGALLTMEQHSKGGFLMDSDLVTQSLIQPYRLAIEGLKTCLVNLRRFFFPKYLSKADRALILAAPVKADVWDIPSDLLEKMKKAAKPKFRGAPRNYRGNNFKRGYQRGGRGRGYFKNYRPRFNRGQKKSRGSSTKKVDKA